jgi:hypothetical protein
MTRGTFSISAALGLLLLSLLTNGSLMAGSIDDIRIVKISPQDKTAVIKSPEGRIQIIKVGDLVGPNGEVIEIIESRIVIEEKTETGLETVIIRMEDGKQRIERIRKMPDHQPMLHSPIQKDKPN